MATRYHLTADGTPKVCVARPGNCTVTVSDKHYSSSEDARLAYERMKSAGTIKSLNGGGIIDRTLKVLNVKKNSDDPEERASVARNTFATPEILNSLSFDPDGTVRSEVAAHSKTPALTLLRLATDKDFTVAVAAKENQAFQMSTKSRDGLLQDRAWLNRLSKNTNPVKRIEAAYNVHNSLENLVNLSRDPQKQIREAVAGNLMSTNLILEQLANDSEPSVRTAVARSIVSPAHVFSKLSKDTDSAVRGAIASNPSTSSFILMKLAKDSDENVRLNMLNNYEVGKGILIEMENDVNSSDFLKDLIKKHRNY